MLKTVFDIETDNFQLYFEKQLQSITEEGKSVIPKDISGRIFRFDGSFNNNGVRKLNFLSKLWILWRSLKKRVWIVVENQESGLNLEEFIALRDAIKRRDFGVKMAETLKTQGTFVTVNKELGDMFDYLNRLSASPTYNYISKYKNFKPTKAAEHNKEVNYIIRFIRHYEGNKKRWVYDRGLSVPEWYILLFLYDKEYASCPDVYHTTFAKAFQSSPCSITKSFPILQSKGLILKHGDTKGSKFSITPMGRDMVVSVLNNYALNC